MSKETIYYPMSRFVNNTGTGKVYCTLPARIVSEPRGNTNISDTPFGDNGMIIACGNIQSISSEGSKDTRDTDIIRTPHLYSCKISAPPICGVSVLETASRRVFSVRGDSNSIKSYRGDLGFCYMLLTGGIFRFVISVFGKKPEQGKITAVKNIVKSIIDGVNNQMKEHDHEPNLTLGDFDMNLDMEAEDMGMNKFADSEKRFRNLVREIMDMIYKNKVTTDFRTNVLNELMRARIIQLNMLFPRFAFYIPPPVDYLHTGFADSSSRVIKDALKIAQGSIGLPRAIKQDIARSLPISVPDFEVIMNNVGHNPAPSSLFGASYAQTMSFCRYAVIRSLHVSESEQMYVTDCASPSNNQFVPRLYHNVPNIAGIVKRNAIREKSSTSLGTANGQLRQISPGRTAEFQRVSLIMCDLVGTGGRAMLEMIDLITRTQNKKFAFMNYAIPELPANRPAILSDILPNPDSKLINGYVDESPIIVLYLGPV